MYEDSSLLTTGRGKEQHDREQKNCKFGKSIVLGWDCMGLYGDRMGRKEAQCTMSAADYGKFFLAGLRVNSEVGGLWVVGCGLWVTGDW